jgi:RNA polymerase sigma-70 factor (ECF subfamily)
MYSLDEHVDHAGFERAARGGDWEQAIDRCVRAGHARWGVEVNRVRLAAWLADRADSAADLEGLHGDDLYLACAIGQRDPDALAIYDEELAPAAAGAARIAGADDDGAERVRAQVKLELGSGRIDRYAGRGDLRGWVRAVAVRTAWRLAAEGAGALLDEELAGALMDDAGIAALREQHADELARALADGLEALTSRHRTVLRLAYLDGLSIDVVARTFAVPRATAAGWVAAAREALFEEVLARVEAVVDAELPAVVRLVQSQVTAGLSRPAHP